MQTLPHPAALLCRGQVGPHLLQHLRDVGVVPEEEGGAVQPLLPAAHRTAPQRSAAQHSAAKECRQNYDQLE